jgi:hypothetical protein
MFDHFVSISRTPSPAISGVRSAVRRIAIRRHIGKPCRRSKLAWPAFLCAISISDKVPLKSNLGSSQ